MKGKNESVRLNSILDNLSPIPFDWPQFANIFFLSLHFQGELYGLEKFWAFRKYYKKWQSLVPKVDPFLLAKLDGYRTVDDFRLDVGFK